jgi:hypothetical protein
VSQALLLLAAGLRLIEFVHAVRWDRRESFLGLNEFEQSPAQLLHALDFKEAAPIGLLELERIGLPLRPKRGGA